MLAMLVAEAALYRRRMAEATLTLLRRLDLLYLFAAIAVIVTGLLRVFFFAKGPAQARPGTAYEARLRALKPTLRAATDTSGEIAAAVGYAELSSFDRLFRRWFGCSPSGVRRR